MRRIESLELTTISQLMPAFDELQIKNEPMLFNCDMSHAYRMGGKITRAFLDLVPLEWHENPVVVDTRVHMLMPGWFPCIPGWHHDDVPRTRSDKQPNYEDGEDRSWHCMALVNADICPTEFAVGSDSFSEIPLGSVCYETWHSEVEEKLAGGYLRRIQASDRQIIIFNDRTWHRGTAAKRAGWRWFGRCSRYFDARGRAIERRNERTNEVRSQVQIYLESVNAGW